jgi:hypothetical protein
MMKFELKNDERIFNNKIRSWKFRLRISFIILISSFVILASGCAKTVTVIGGPGDQMVVEVTLRGTLNEDANRYFLVLSADPAYEVPLPAPDLIEESPEMIEPGTDPIIGSQEAYYTNFFTSWDGYIILDPSGYSLVKGPFSLNSPTTREVLATLTEASTRIRFTFRLEQIFATVPDRIYFDFITAAWPDAVQKVPTDHLPSTDNSIARISGSLEEIDDSEDGSLAAGLDILGCKIEMQ